ncbi:MAG TPA: hypothetical protein VGS08_01575 [Candidatus Saccharimonadales bacterium]|nr:hypothetical protein [Candidatus Saccharimonadales bacterium]
MTISVARLQVFTLAAVGCIAAVVIMVGIWNRNNADPGQIFWAAIANNLSTQGMTIQVSQSSGGGTEQQLTQVGFGAYPLVRTLTVLSGAHSLVKTEDLSTPRAEYTRYDQLETDHRARDGRPINFSSAIGVWAQTATTRSVGTSPPAYGQILLGLSLPAGDLPLSQRSQLIAQMQNDQVYTADFAHVKKKHFEGRAVDVYSVTIQPLLYIQLMKSYATDMGLHQLDQLSPNSYAGQPAISMNWVIDARAKQLVRADYGGGRVETYSGYGVPVTTPVPAHPIAAQALQQRVSQLIND